MVVSVIRASALAWTIFLSQAIVAQGLGLSLVQKRATAVHQTSSDDFSDSSTIGLNVSTAKPTLYCVVTMMHGYEEELLKTALANNAGIFACDDFTVFSSEKRFIGMHPRHGLIHAVPFNTSVPVGLTALNSSGNTLVFLNMWSAVKSTARYHLYDWTVKLDPDAVFFPERLRAILRPHTETELATFGLNCRSRDRSAAYGLVGNSGIALSFMLGALETFSRKALWKYFNHTEEATERAERTLALRLHHYGDAVMSQREGLWQYFNHTKEARRTVEFTMENFTGLLTTNSTTNLTAHQSSLLTTNFTTDLTVNLTRTAEDIFIMDSMYALGLSPFSDFNMLADRYCNFTDWQMGCKGMRHAAYHPYKNSTDWMSCWKDASASSQAQPTVQAQPKVQAQPEVRPKFQAQKVQPVVQTQPEVQPKVQSQPKVQPVVQTQPKEAQPKVEAQPTVQAQPVVQAQPKGSDAGASATEDSSQAPSISDASHVSNNRGERFDIYEFGQMEFLRVPYESAPSKANLTVLVTIQGANGSDPQCDERRYMKSVHFGGAWLEGRLLDVTVQRGQMGVLFGGAPMQPSRQSLRIGNMLQLHMPDENQLHVGFGETWIDISSDNQPAHHFLSMQARSLGSLGCRIGGLLGEDEHLAASTPQSECNLVVLKAARSARKMMSWASRAARHNWAARAAKSSQAAQAARATARLGRLHGWFDGRMTP